MDGTVRDDATTMPLPASPEGPYGAVPVLLRVPVMAPRGEPPTPAPAAAPVEPPRAEREIPADPDRPEPPPEEDEAPDDLVFGEVPGETWEPPSRSPVAHRSSRFATWKLAVAATLALVALLLFRPGRWVTPPSDGSPPEHTEPDVVRSAQKARPTAPRRMVDAEPAAGRLAPVGADPVPPAASQPAAWTTAPDTPEALSTVAAQQPTGPAWGTEPAPAATGGSAPSAYPRTDPETSRFEYPPGEYEQFDALLPPGP